MGPSRPLRDLMRAPSLNLKLDGLKLGGLSLSRRSSPRLVGLDIQPGYVAAVEAHVNGSVLVERAAGIAIPGDAVREGEVADEGVLSEALRELFRSSHMDRSVRVGVANQRTVLRILELPPITDRKELEAAVRFQAVDQVPMPLDNAVLDFHPIGTIETPAGLRQRVILVAAQRDMVQRLLGAVRGAGLRPGGIDLSAFALIRSLYTPGEEQDSESRVLYLNVGGLTNMAIAEGKLCRFTRVIGKGLESIAGSIAAAQSIPLSEARELLSGVDLAPGRTVGPEPAGVESLEESLAPAESTAIDEQIVDDSAEEPEPNSGSIDLRPVLEGGLREIAGEVRNSLEFHRLQEGGGDVSTVVLSGPALGITGFAQALEAELGMPISSQSVGLLTSDSAGSVPPEHLAVAAGLAVEEAPR